jgi:hypothetical protein
MWYNSELKIRATHHVTFPDGLRITAEDANGSPIRGWEWHDEPPEWFEELERLNSTENDENEYDG